MVTHTTAKQSKHFSVFSRNMTSTNSAPSCSSSPEVPIFLSGVRTKNSINLSSLKVKSDLCIILTHLFSSRTACSSPPAYDRSKIEWGRPQCRRISPFRHDVRQLPETSRLFKRIDYETTFGQSDPRRPKIFLTFVSAAATNRVWLVVS